jgi:hypothetical protein
VALGPAERSFSQDAEVMDCGAFATALDEKEQRSIRTAATPARSSRRLIGFPELRIPRV